jgi:hopanoid biosynthesis associated protein HpnK
LRAIILTGDDFGLAVPVNEAIIRAHREGVLTAASLMVGANCAPDAVERARECPLLKIGLHIVLVEGKAILPPDAIPDLVNAGGEFSNELVRTGFRYFFRTGIRRQLEAEIRAQFKAFRDTGLPLDHVNAHNHLHLHPTVLGLIVKVGREFGLRAVRLPHEPPIRSWKASGKGIGSKLVSSAFLRPWLAIMKRTLRRADIRCNDALFGMADSGAMKLDLVLRFIRNLPAGVTELHFHPATRRCPEIDATMPGYMHEQELGALTSEKLRGAIRDAGVTTISFSDLE